MLAPPDVQPWADDRGALRAACEPDVGLCTIVGIEGSFSRRLGAQLAVDRDGNITGSLADGCLERQLASEIAAAAVPIVKRFGSGSELIDFRLPCGSGLDVLIDPTPDRTACRAAVERLASRQPANLVLPAGDLRERSYIPALRLQLFGEGPELSALASLARAAGVACDIRSKDALGLGRAPVDLGTDRWTAVVMLFHDHEWEQALLAWALATPAFYIGAQGGFEARNNRREQLARRGLSAGELDRIRSPIGVLAHSREPMALALSVLAEIVGEYEKLHPHA